MKTLEKFYYFIMLKLWFYFASSLVGYRVNQIYDIDNKTYLIKLYHNEERSTLLFESGIRIQTTNFEVKKELNLIKFILK